MELTIANLHTLIKTDLYLDSYRTICKKKRTHW